MPSNARDDHHQSNDIEQVAAARSTALVEQDVDRMREFLAEDFTYTNASGDSCDRQEYLDFYLASPGLVWLDQSVTDQVIRTYGDTSVVTFDVHDRVTYRGQRSDGRYRSLYVYVRRGSSWQCVAGQTTARPS